MAAQQLQQSMFICHHYHTLYAACSEHILLQSSPEYLSESGYHRMRVDRQI